MAEREKMPDVERAERWAERIYSETHDVDGGLPLLLELIHEVQADARQVAEQDRAIVEAAKMLDDAPLFAGLTAYRSVPGVSPELHERCRSAGDKLLNLKDAIVRAAEGKANRG